MPRPKKWRQVCCLPRNTEFAPVGAAFCPGDAVVMTVDEFETIRLIDYEDFNQEQCAGSMKIARTTVQQIYTNARKKLAQSLVEGKPLRINGGEYRLCGEHAPLCGCGGCRRRRCGGLDEEKERKRHETDDSCG